MPRFYSFLFRFCTALLALAISLTPRLHATTFLLEAEQLELPGGWETVATPRDEFVHKYLLAGPHAKGAPAAGAVDLPHAGRWRLWVRSKDYPADRPGIRHFTVRLGNTRSPTIFGRHGHAESDGWAWEDGGTFDLPSGPTLVAIGDDFTPSARCDALLLSDNPAYQPAGVPWKLAKAPATLVPLTISEKSKQAFLPEPLRATQETPLVTLQNGAVRFSFHEASTAGGTAIALHATTRAGDLWVPLEGADAESYRVLFRPRDSDPKIALPHVHPRGTPRSVPSSKQAVAGRRSRAAWASRRPHGRPPTV